MIKAGYQRKKDKVIKPVSPKPERPKLKPRIPLPENFAHANYARTQLAKELSKYDDNVCSMDVVDNNWVLVIRSYDPSYEHLYDTYMGYEVKFIQSRLIRNPMSRTKHS